MRAILILAFICSVSMVTYGQENLIRWDENQPLRWADFGGKVKDSSWLDAECFAEVGYRYKFNSLKNFQFEIFAHFHKTYPGSKKKIKLELY